MTAAARFRAATCAGALVLVALALSSLVEAHDDAYISFRYADNLAAGDGLAFNPTDDASNAAVEGFSTPSFVLLISGLIRLGLHPATAAVVVNALSLTLLLGFAARWSGELGLSNTDPNLEPAVQEDPVTPAWISGAVAIGTMLAHPGILYYLLSGMETLFFAMLVGLAAFMLRRSLRGLQDAAAFGGTLGLLALTRPEAIGFAALLAMIAIVDVLRGETSRQTAVVAVGVLVATWSAWMLFRWSYYGQWAPNTYYAKIGPWDLRRLKRGVEYVLGAGYWIAAPLLLAPLAFRSTSRSALIALVPLGYFATFALYAGGDWMSGQRLLLPALISAAVWIGAAAPRLVAKARSAPALLSVGAACALILLAAVVGLAQLHSWREAKANSAAIASFLDFGELLATADQPATVAIGAVGAVGYASGGQTIDAFGLTDAVIARNGEWDASNTVGHQRSDGLEVWRRRPEIIVPLNDALDTALSEELLLARVADDPNRTWVKRLRDQPAFSSTYRYRVAKLDTGKFLALYLRNDTSLPGARFEVTG